ncbi:Uncharacterized protein DBV15_11134 [Temnothorax longispinosus]|uniref:Uncharacterized protein n=1 Tax=Temnothorax longispinosus TaxID=300112 RepID=A0A4S2KL97_9HYME|nr:Uncharacterized protein DBV15_11134 [Temnothorax longispinosus]
MAVCGVLCCLSCQTRPGLPFALDGPREIKHFGVSSLMETEQNEEEQGWERRTEDEGRRTTWLAGTGSGRIKTNEHGRVLCSLCRREIGMTVNLRDKSFTNSDHAEQQTFKEMRCGSLVDFEQVERIAGEGWGKGYMERERKRERER